MTFSNAFPVFAACRCRERVVLSLLYDVSTAWPCGEVQAWVYSQIGWNVLSLFLWSRSSGLEAHICGDAFQPQHCRWVGSKACSCCTPQGTFSAPSLWLFGVKLQLARNPDTTLFHILSTLQVASIQTSQFQLKATQESHEWVAGHSASSLVREGQNVAWVLFPAPQLWFYFTGLLCMAWSNFPRSPPKWSEAEIVFVSCFSRDQGFPVLCFAQNHSCNADP